MRAAPQDYPVDDTDAGDKTVSLQCGWRIDNLVGCAHFPRLRPSDFRTKTLDGVGDDWPISYEDLATVLRVKTTKMMGGVRFGGRPLGTPKRGPRQMPTRAAGQSGRTYGGRM